MSEITNNPEKKTLAELMGITPSSKVLDLMSKIDESKTKYTFEDYQSFIAKILKDVKCVIDSSGIKTFYSVNPITNIATNINKTQLLSTVGYAFSTSKNMKLPAKSQKDHLDTWMLTFNPQKSDVLPPSFSIDCNEVTYNRINVSLVDGPTPTWDAFIKNCGNNGDSLMAFTYSLLEKDCKSQQYLFLKGHGQDGKGSYTRWLDKIFNDQVVGLNTQDKYWPAACVGKRVGTFSDINNTAIVMSSTFKQVTGQDKVSIEQKYETAYSTTLDTKFILTTNRSINIINDNAEKRRVILINMLSSMDIPDFEQKLHDETASFLFKCRQAYNLLYDIKTKTISCNYDDFEAETSSFEEANEVLFESLFDLDPKSHVTAKEFQDSVSVRLGKDTQKVGQFKEWLERTHKIKRKEKRVGNNQKIYVYCGIKL